MANKKEQIKNILNLIKSLNISIDDLRMESGYFFLTYGEAKEKADGVRLYEKGVYSYKTNGEWYTIQNS